MPTQAEHSPPKVKDGNSHAADSRQVHLNPVRGRMARTIELLTAAEVRQNGTDAAMYRHAFSFPDDEAKGSGVDHFALA